jgi:uncharacterized protein (TIGR02266 family)
MSSWVEPTEAERAEMAAADAAIARRDQELAEQRRSQRVAFHASVSVASDTNFFCALSENVSEGGVFLATYSPPGVGETVLMRVEVDGVGAIDVEGTVRWVRVDEDGSPSGCGVQFGAMDERTQRGLKVLMERAPKDPLLAGF